MTCRLCLILVVHARDQTERRELEVAVVTVARSIANRSKQDEAVLAVYPTVLDVPNRISLLNVLGKIGAPASLPVLQTALQDKSPDVRASAIRALSEWPTGEPYPDLWRCATEAKEPSHRILALRGSVRLIGLDSSLSADQTIERYRKAMAIAPNEAERKFLLSAIGEVRSVSALQLVAAYLNDTKLHQEAEVATLAIAEDLTGAAARETVSPLKQLVASSTDSVNVARAKRLLKRIESNE